jgi:hypothetical protein
MSKMTYTSFVSVMVKGCGRGGACCSLGLRLLAALRLIPIACKQLLYRTQGKKELKHELHVIRILWKQGCLTKFKTIFSTALCLVEF